MRVTIRLRLLNSLEVWFVWGTFAPNHPRTGYTCFDSSSMFYIVHKLKQTILLKFCLSFIWCIMMMH